MNAYILQLQTNPIPDPIADPASDPFREPMPPPEPGYLPGRPAHPESPPDHNPVTGD
jgi:hypothetical protein